MFFFELCILNGFANKLNNMRERMKFMADMLLQLWEYMYIFEKKNNSWLLHILTYKKLFVLWFLWNAFTRKISTSLHILLVKKDVKCKKNQFKYITEHINITQVIWFLQLSPHIIQTFSMHFITGFKYSV